MDSVEKKVKDLNAKIRRNNYTQPVALKLTVAEVRALAAFISLWRNKN